MSLLPVVALVGRPNVGKSTLFNRLTRSRAALVADVPGLTRDRLYGQARVGERRFIVIDTGGFEPVATAGIAAEMARQARQAIVEADLVVFVVDGREGLAARDQDIANELRRTASRVVVAVNKTEGMPRDQAVADAWSLGLGRPHPVSAAHGDGVRELSYDCCGLAWEKDRQGITTTYTRDALGRVESTSRIGIAQNTPFGPNSTPNASTPASPSSSTQKHQNVIHVGVRVSPAPLNACMPTMPQP